MAELKTKATAVSVDDFIDKQKDELVRDDCRMLVKIMRRVTGEKPKMWGPSIIGFGQYHYKYESGHEGDMCLAGFSPRSGKLAVYLLGDGVPELMEKLGKYKRTTGCLYIKKMSDIDEKVLEKLIANSIKETQKKYNNKTTVSKQAKKK